MEHREILGIGEVVVDMVSVIDHFPEPDEKVDSISQNNFSGGVTANYVVAAARLGAKTAFFGAIGQDEHGAFLKRDFLAENVDISHLIELKRDTPVNFIPVVKTTGEKMIIQSPYMHTTVPQLKDFDPAIIQSFQLVHSTAIYPEIVDLAFQTAQEHGILTSLDLEKQIAIWGLPKLKPILKHVDILLPNKTGAMTLTQTNTPIEAARIFLKWGIPKIIITLGNEGAMIFTPQKEIKVPGFTVTAVDTTGAGDTFAAAVTFVHGIKHVPIEEACTFANAAAALKVQQLGARTGMPRFKQVKAFLEAHNIHISIP